MTPDTIAGAFRMACRAELQALKPGNVHFYADGHGMTPADFEASAEAAAPHIAARGASVGERISGAVTATLACAGQNTNLGIVLLCAPLAAAVETMPEGGSLREAAGGVLAALTVNDAELGFRAIAQAAPGGLGIAAEHDVRGQATVPLLEAMRAAAHRDRVARQYATNFADIFEMGLLAAREVAADDSTAMLAPIAERVYWRFLIRIPDSHIARKYGATRADEICAQAAALDARLALTASKEDRHALLLAFDGALKAAAMNPGTSADLTVATLFVHILERNYV